MSDVSGLLDALGRIVGDQFVHTTPALEAYCVDGCAPRVMVSPGDIDQVAAILALSQRDELAVIPWGGGTTMGMGHPPERMDLILNLQRLNQVLEHEPADLTATTQTGITMAALQRQLGERQQWWPVEPPCAEHATLGGVLATNTSGPKRLLYGTARDLLIGIKVVHADGTISKAGGKVTKNVTGYDMMKLYIGSLGTLAVIVEATLKLRPLPTVQQVAWATFPSLESAGEAARQVLTAGLLPNAIELVNPTLALLLQQAIEQTNGRDGWSVIVGVDGSTQAVERQTRDIETLVHQSGALAWHTWPDDGRLWQTLQGRFRANEPGRNAQVILRLGTVPSETGVTLNHLSGLGLRLNIPLELSARVGNGLVYASLPLNGAPEQLTESLVELRGQLARQRGYVVVEHAPPSLKALFDCWGDLGPQSEVMAGLKRAFDPQRVLNPGRFVHHL